MSLKNVIRSDFLEFSAGIPLTTTVNLGSYPHSSGCDLILNKYTRIISTHLTDMLEGVGEKDP